MQWRCVWSHLLHRFPSLPHACWISWSLRRAGRYSEEVLKSTNELETVVTIVCANQRQMPRRDPLRPYMEIIAAYAGV